MNTELEKNTPATEEHENSRKKSRGTLLWVLLVVILFLFLLTTIVLGSRLYDMSTRDRYTVDLGLGELDGSIELFRVEYENASGEITVQGTNGENVVAPGTSVSYDIRLRNNDDVIIDFLMTPTVTFLSGDEVPVLFKIVDDYGNYILGGDDAWASAEAMNNLTHKGSIHPGEVFTYHVVWQWAFEVSSEQDAYDTFLGNLDGDSLPGVTVGLETQSSANAKPAKSNTHMMHLLGEGFGCCWCCWLVWILLLVILALLVRMWFLRRKINKQVDTLDEYEEVLKKHGLLIDGALIGKHEV